MTEPTLSHVKCLSPRGLHRLAYWEWGPADAPVLLCVHGLSRNGRDFDPLAERLQDGWRVVCPDMIGRGASDFMADPNLYSVPQYVADCVTLIARLGRDSVTWLGTSMGGMIGMALASMPGAPISRLILNDIGPVIDPVGRDRITGYVGAQTRFASFEEGERTMRQNMSEFGPHDDAQFRYLSRHSIVQRDGQWTYHYDPNIAVPYKQAMSQPWPPLWPMYDAIACPTALIRGGQSDILSAAVAQEMTGRGPRASLVTIPGVGHAPTFIADDQIAVVERLLGG